MVMLIGCFEFTADMGSLEFSNQETEYKLRRGMSSPDTLLVIQGSYEQVILQKYSFIILLVDLPIMQIKRENGEYITG